MTPDTQPSASSWALILGVSSGFGAATALELARAGYSIAGVHFDRRDTLPLALQVQQQVEAYGVRALFFNVNAAEEDRRAEVVSSLSREAVSVRVLLHSLAFGALKPLTGAGALSRKQMEMTADVMGHSLIYWVNDLLAAGLLASGARIFAMTSEGSTKAIPQYGAVSAAKSILESHIRQLALELAPLGISANAILAGVTDTPALRKIPGSEAIISAALARNPSGRLTRPEDVARAIAVLAAPGAYWITGNTIRVDGGEGIVP